jgi:hypothetical protein
MFGIVWLKRGAEIARESSDINRPEDVVRYARAKATTSVVQSRGNEPDEFRIIDQSGHEIARQHLG